MKHKWIYCKVFIRILLLYYFTLSARVTRRIIDFPVFFYTKVDDNVVIASIKHYLYRAKIIHTIVASDNNAILRVCTCASKTVEKSNKCHAKLCVNVLAILPAVVVLSVNWHDWRDCWRFFLLFSQRAHQSRMKSEMNINIVCDRFSVYFLNKFRCSSRYYQLVLRILNGIIAQIHTHIIIKTRDERKAISNQVTAPFFPECLSIYRIHMSDINHIIWIALPPNPIVAFSIFIWQIHGMKKPLCCIFSIVLLLLLTQLRILFCHVSYLRACVCVSHIRLNISLLSRWLSFFVHTH